MTGATRIPVCFTLHFSYYVEFSICNETNLVHSPLHQILCIEILPLPIP